MGKLSPKLIRVEAAPLPGAPGRRVCVFDDGTRLPYVAGGDGTGGGAGGGGGGAGGDAGAGGGGGGGNGGAAGGSGAGNGGGQPRTFTQDEVNRMLAAEKDQGGRHATTELLKALGVDKIEDATAILTRAREADRAAMTETERAKAEAADAKRLADADRLAAANDRKAAAIELGLQRAGLQLPEKAEDAAEALGAAVRLVDVAGEPTAAAVNAAVEKVKQQFPSLFGKAAGNGNGQRLPGGDPAGRGGRPAGAPTGVAAGRERARQEREEAAKRPDPLSRLSFVGGERRL